MDHSFHPAFTHASYDRMLKTQHAQYRALRWRSLIIGRRRQAKLHRLADAGYYVARTFDSVDEVTVFGPFESRRKAVHCRQSIKVHCRISWLWEAPTHDRQLVDQR